MRRLVKSPLLAPRTREKWGTRHPAMFRRWEKAGPSTALASLRSGRDDRFWRWVGFCAIAFLERICVGVGVGPILVG